MFPRRTVLALSALLSAACRTVAPPIPDDRALSSCIPSDTLVLASLDLAKFRSSPVVSQLPAPVAAINEVYRDASRVTLAYDGKELLIIAEGSFQTAPAGATLLDSRLSLSGSDAAVRAAIARHRQTPPATSTLLAYARTVGKGKALWVVAPGGVALPLSGNAANLNRLLRDSEFAAVTATLGPPIQLDFTAVGRTPDAARNVEETLRAALMLATAAEKRGSAAAKLLATVPVDRDQGTVHAAVSVDAPTFSRLLSEMVH